MAAIDENMEVSLDDVGNVDNPDLKNAIEQIEKAGENIFGRFCWRLVDLFSCHIYNATKISYSAH